MPMSNYRSSFGPEELAVLEQAFNMACAEAIKLGLAGTEEQSVREFLAKEIVSTAGQTRRA